MRESFDVAAYLLTAAWALAGGWLELGRELLEDAAAVLAVE